ncbi:unnamed protein product [Microthlaspi erraticum]|uniref:Pre-mRNA-processing factor 17 n=1 Tax=Microthlaspi erraticum TaxID=1685480 RepID=A0A6D2I6C6_9BRAS|nr:unnamed protein product [Microthlaspi erraticum]
MDLIQSYDEEAVSSSPESSPPRMLKAKSSAPEVDDTALALTVANVNQSKSQPINPTQHAVVFNPTYDSSGLRSYGPAHPYAKDGIAQGMRNHKLGFVEDASIGSFGVRRAVQHFSDVRLRGRSVRVELRRRYGGVEAERRSLALKNPWSKEEGGGSGRVDGGAEEVRRGPREEEGEKDQQGEAKGEHYADKSTFHGKEEKDYQGRSWIEAPKDAKATTITATSPNVWFTHGVVTRKAFPLFASSQSRAFASLCRYGLQVLTAGYDKNIKYWDTETGQVISTFSTGKIPYVVKLNPDDDKQNILLAGMSDKKIVQWDINTGEITQEYDQHLGAVNTITFVDNNRRFVTSSDDKSLRVWEFGIPVVIKYISEPHMHSMPAVSVHPNGKWVAAQSLDNQILIYSARERFQLNKKKRFAGHVVAGYACQVNFSPDGRFVMSGDGEGKCWFWDWKSCKVFRTLRCHNGVCIGAEWHPLEQSKVATCGWDGLIKYWD